MVDTHGHLYRLNLQLVKVYISSTFEDLVDYRTAAADVLRKLGHDVLGMEQYVAESARPVDRCVQDAGAADVLILVLAWRYGFTDTVEAKSITEREYEAAVESKNTVVLPFLVPPDAPWPPYRMDAITEERPRERIRDFRDRVSRAHIVAMFTTPDGLASEVAAAMRRAEATNRLSDKALRATNTTGFNVMSADGHMDDATVGTISEAIASAADTEVVTVDLGTGQNWWSTRLYLLAALADDLTSIGQFLFVTTSSDSRLGQYGAGAVIGLATPSMVRDRLCREFPVLKDFQTRAAKRTLVDPVDETGRRLAMWETFFQPRKSVRSGGEKGERVWVRRHLLVEWLGEYLIRGSVNVDRDVGISAQQVQQILEWPWPYVPVIGLPDDDDLDIEDPSTQRRSVRVVNRDEFARQIAREWIAREIPRSPRV